MFRGVEEREASSRGGRDQLNRFFARTVVAAWRSPATLGRRYGRQPRRRYQRVDYLALQFLGHRLSEHPQPRRNQVNDARTLYAGAGDDPRSCGDQHAVLAMAPCRRPVHVFTLTQSEYGLAAV